MTEFQWKASVSIMPLLFGGEKKWVAVVKAESGHIDAKDKVVYEWDERPTEEEARKVRDSVEQVLRFSFEYMGNAIQHAVEIVKDTDVSPSLPGEDIDA